MAQFNWERLKPYAFHRGFRGFLQVLMRLMYNVKIVGHQNTTKSAGGIILACNHLHAIDPGFLMIATRRRWRFIAKQELFRSKPSAWLCTHNNAFPVNREIIDRRALDYAVAVLKDGRCGLGIFPEGQRSPDGTPQAAKNGIATLARQARAAVLPCSLYYEGPLKLRTKVTVRIGELIPFEHLGLGGSPNKRESCQATEKVMAAVTQLWAQGHG